MHLKDLMTGNKFTDYRVTIVSTHNLQGNICHSMHFLFLSAQRIGEVNCRETKRNIIDYSLMGGCPSGKMYVNTGPWLRSGDRGWVNLSLNPKGGVPFPKTNNGFYCCSLF